MMPGYQAPDSETAYDVFFKVFFFFQSDRPTQYQETHSTVNNKRGMALCTLNKENQCSVVRYANSLIISCHPVDNKVKLRFPW